MPTFVAKDRLWLTRDGSSPLGRTIWRHPFPAVLNNWAILWRTLRARIPSDIYRSGTPVTAAFRDAEGVTITTAEGIRRFDALVGADGHASVVRSVLEPAAPPTMAPYVAWRGTLDSRGPASRHLMDVVANTVVTICFDRGHAMVYLVPGIEQDAAALVNWALYASTPAMLNTRSYLPPGHVPAAAADTLLELARAQLPPAWADLLEATGLERLAMQPVEDVAATRYGLQQVVLVGDAGSVSRPHTGSGAVKALQDALCLERLGRSASTWAELSAAYEKERRSTADALVQLGRAFGRRLVEETPLWRETGADDLRMIMAEAQRDSQWVYSPAGEQ